MRRRSDEQNKSVVLPNGSRIVGVPSKPSTVRGFSGVLLLIIDEAAHAPGELYLALRPVLASSGSDLWCLSTPNGKRGFFWDAWANGGPLLM